MPDQLVKLHSNGAYWQVVYRDTSGALVRKSLAPKSKLSRAAALREVQRIAVQFTNQPGRRDVRESPTLGKWRDRYFELRTELAEASIVSQRHTFGLLAAKFGEHRGLDTITRLDAAAWRAGVAGRKTSKGEKVSEATVRLHVRNAKTIFNFAVKRDLIPFNPFDREASSVVEIQRRWEFITDAQLGAIMDKCPNQGWRALFALCRLAGLRRGEAIRAGWQDMDWDRRVLTVWHDGPETTKRRCREVPVVPALYALLDEWYQQAPDGSRAICANVGPHNLITRATAIIQAAGVGAYSKPFHTLRKNRESTWLAEHPIMDVCRWMGHSPEVARKHYHQTPEAVLQAATGQNQSVAAQTATKSPQNQGANV